jgi:thiamine-monophosphate kinase
MLSEFSLIDRYFAYRHQRRHDAELGIGDDCALIAPPAGQMLAISTDMLVEGRHFFADIDPVALGHKALAVNLSDLAAMGAEPRAFTLALALPELDARRERWLDGFAHGMFDLAERFGCELIGGDTTAGPLNICITVFGDVPAHDALRRSAAMPGDDVWVSGMLGDARLALGALRGEWHVGDADLPRVRRALEWPEPRVALGRALRGVAHAALDLSDGLAGDLSHILARSNVTARIDIDALPRSAALHAQPLEIRHRCAIEGGDDYELCFTASPERRTDIANVAARVGVPLTRIGTISAPAESGTDAMDAEARPADTSVGARRPTGAPDTNGTSADDARAPSRIVWHDAAGQPVGATWRSFDHFHAK